MWQGNSGFSTRCSSHCRVFYNFSCEFYRDNIGIEQRGSDHIGESFKTSPFFSSLPKSLNFLVPILSVAIRRQLFMYCCLHNCTTARKIMCIRELTELAEDCNNKTAVWRNMNPPWLLSLPPRTKSWRLIYICTISTYIHQALIRASVMSWAAASSGLSSSFWP